MVVLFAPRLLKDIYEFSKLLMGGGTRIKSVGIVGADAAGKRVLLGHQECNVKWMAQEQSRQPHSRPKTTLNGLGFLSGEKHLGEHGTARALKTIKHVLTNQRIYDADPTPIPAVRSGRLPPDVDPPLKIPETLPRVTPPNQQERWTQTPIYDSLTQVSKVSL